MYQFSKKFHFFVQNTIYSDSDPTVYISLNFAFDITDVYMISASIWRTHR